MPLFDDARAAWGARLTTLTAAQFRANTVPPRERLGVSYHYPGSSTWPITPASPHSQCLRRVSDWQRAHQAKGWNDLGYNVVICQHARAIEGRPIDQKGSHSPGVNWTHYGVNLMVANDAPPTPAMYARAAQVHADLTKRSGRSLRAWGHGDDPAASTACPGRHIEAWVKAGGPFKTPAKPAPKEDDMPLSDSDIKRIADAVWNRILTSPREGTRDTSAQNWVKYANLRTADTLAAVGRNAGQVAGLATAVQQLGAGKAIDMSAITAAAEKGAREGVAESIDSIDVTIRKG